MRSQARKDLQRRQVGTLGTIHRSRSKTKSHLLDGHAAVFRDVMKATCLAQPWAHNNESINSVCWAYVPGIFFFKEFFLC